MIIFFLKKARTELEQLKKFNNFKKQLGMIKRPIIKMKEIEKFEGLVNSIRDLIEEKNYN
jgi:hypothetical protein